MKSDSYLSVESAHCAEVILLVPGDSPTSVCQMLEGLARLPLLPTLLPLKAQGHRYGPRPFGSLTSQPVLDSAVSFCVP